MKTKKMEMGFGNFTSVIVAVYFAYLRILLCIETFIGHFTCLKRLITETFGSSKQFIVNGLNEPCVNTIPT